jgi:UDP-hydrolysing UDP-N-acetyl-D-glucosamine 2-epimerase
VKVMIVTGSRSDWNGLSVVNEALQDAKHETVVVRCDGSSSGLAYLSAAFHAGAHLPDFVLLAGDRYEILASALVASIAGIPIAHIAGGDRTEGSQDDRFRDAITALACVHCTTTAQALKRVHGMARGTDWVCITGSPAIDLIRTTPLMSRQEVFDAFGLSPRRLNLLVSVHPNTMGEGALHETNEVINAINKLGNDAAVVCTGANADVGGGLVNARLRAWCESKSDARRFVDNMPAGLYFSVLDHFSAMVGNSSAGYYEAPSFGIQVVDVGSRQWGRVLSSNINNVPVNANAIYGAVISAERRGRWSDRWNPYGDGHSAPRIVKALEANAWRCKSRE